METPATYIYCNRFDESKSILICATRCAYSLGCKDWATALSGELRGQIESEAREYAAKKGVVINPDVWSPLQPRRGKMSSRPTASPLSLASPGVGPRVMANEERISDLRKQPLVSGVKESKRKKVESKPRKRASTHVQAPRQRKASGSQSTVFLVLERNGRYREVKSEEEMKRIAIESAGKNRKGIRFARATLLEVEVMFRPVR